MSLALSFRSSPLVSVRPRPIGATPKEPLTPYGGTKVPTAIPDTSTFSFQQGGICAMLNTPFFSASHSPGFMVPFIACCWMGKVSRHDAVLARPARTRFPDMTPSWPGRREPAINTTKSPRAPSLFPTPSPGPHLAGDGRRPGSLARRASGVATATDGSPPFRPAGRWARDAAPPSADATNNADEKYSTPFVLS